MGFQVGVGQDCSSDLGLHFFHNLLFQYLDDSISKRKKKHFLCLRIICACNTNFLLLNIRIDWPQPFC